MPNFRTLFDLFRVETILFARDLEQAHLVACRARAEYRDELPRLDRIFERVWPLPGNLVKSLEKFQQAANPHPPADKLL